MEKMKVEIWSDVVCPFCYIGKRKFETAFEQFAHKDQVEVVWKSYQLNPELRTDTSKTLTQSLAESKHISTAQAQHMADHATALAANSGLDFRFDIAIPANTMLAHRFSHLALELGKQNEAEEALFKAYFTEGKNVDDLETLLNMAAEIGLDPELVKQKLTGFDYQQEVLFDMQEAQAIGVRGVPFYVFDRKVAVSGAQDPAVFADVLQDSFKTWQEANQASSLAIVEGEVCGPDGNC